MDKSIFKEIKQKHLDIYLSKNDYAKDFYFKKFFPMKYIPFLDFHTLIGSKGNPVAADVVSYNASAPEKSRKVVSRLAGSIPAIKMKRIMTEKDINEYNILKNDPGSNKAELLKMIFDDIDAAYQGCLARLEWFALQAVCQGYVALDSSNNGEGVVTENNIDFQMPAANKRKIKSATATRVWNNGTAANYLPITDIEDIVAAARVLGIKFKYMLMNETKWAQMRAATEVIQYAANLNTAVRTPTVAQLNSVLVAHGLPKLVVVNSLIDLEDKDHTITATDAWTTKYVSFIPDTKLGNALCGPIASDTHTPKQALKSKKDNVVILKYSTTDPVNEITEGQLNAFPSFPTIDRVFRFDTEGTPEADGLDD